MTSASQRGTAAGLAFAALPFAFFAVFLTLAFRG